jgi:hypothetical protein
MNWAIYRRLILEGNFGVVSRLQEQILYQNLRMYCSFMNFSFKRQGNLQFVLITKNKLFLAAHARPESSLILVRISSSSLVECWSQRW